MCLADVPYPPTLHLLTTGECNSITAKWSPPTREAVGGPVMDYLAQIKRKDTEDPWRNCTSPHTSKLESCMFTNLEKDTLFEVRVKARNKIGFGWPSRNFTKTGNAGNYWSLNKKKNIQPAET